MEYPFDIISYVRNKTFSVEARFTKETTEHPLKVFDDAFSRFIFTVIQDGKAATSNIPLDILAECKEISTYAYTKTLDAKLNAPAGNENASIAFTERFRTGDLKGKSPVDVILENGDKAGDILNKQYTWLREKLAQYPANKTLMDAITEAAKLSAEDIENAKKSREVTAPPITLLDIGVRPLVRKTREDGKSFCYECSVTWNPAMKMPVVVRISNYYAPVETKENGMLNVKISQKDKATEVQGEFAMTASEWFNVLDNMKVTRDGFRTMNFAEAFRIAEKAEIEARQNAKKEKENN